ncbi:hypothetical protein C8J56DRAFT_889745 [Mycena floridula]|nr:hypothetical protein C8J56DRAFT_904452 [Mycena floridula]KAJ7588994.1 hypothetical protein C8J56DRAFT_889745 [Mycena floridula]
MTLTQLYTSHFDEYPELEVGRETGTSRTSESSPRVYNWAVKYRKSNLMLAHAKTRKQAELSMSEIQKSYYVFILNGSGVPDHSEWDNIKPKSNNYLALDAVDDHWFRHYTPELQKIIERSNFLLIPVETEIMFTGSWLELNKVDLQVAFDLLRNDARPSSL